MPAVVAETEVETISLRGAARLSGLNTYRIMKLVTLGQIKAVVRMGEPIRYVKADVIRAGAEYGK